jgi:RNA polymerase sigma factor (sigma-70 family)
MSSSVLEQVYRDHYAELVRLGRLLGNTDAAEDLAQSAFIKLARSPELRNPDAVGAFLRRCVINQSRTDYRRHMLWNKLLPRLVDDRPPTPPDDVQRLIVRRALHKLSRRQREVVVLRYVADLSVAETAGLLGIAEGTVKATAHDALRKLAMRLEAEGVR